MSAAAAETGEMTGPRGLASTIVISALLGAFAGYLWIGRGRAAFVFLAATFAFGLLVLWRLYQGDAWVGWLAPLFANGLVAWATVMAVSLLLVLPLRKSSRPFRWYSRWWAVALAFIVATALSWAVAIGIRSFVVQPFSIPSSSMQPALMPGDYAFVSKRAYGYGPYSLPFGPWPSLRDRRTAQPARGDIVVFKYPPNPELDYIMRVIGLPGERIQVVSGVVHINGTPLRLEPAEPPAQMAGMEEPGASFQREYLPEGRNYVVENLVDGSIGDDTAEFDVPAGHYFMMGDNRDNASDSRFQVGFVPEENVVGRAEVIYWNGEGVGWRDRRLLAPEER